MARSQSSRSTTRPSTPSAPACPKASPQRSKPYRKTTDVKAAVLIGGGRTFIAGADIKEFGKVTSGERRGGSLLPLLTGDRRLPEADDRRDSRHGFWRRAGSRDGLSLSRRRAVSAGRPAGSQARHHSRRGRHAAASAPCGRRRRPSRCARSANRSRRKRRSSPGSLIASSKAICFAGAVDFAREIIAKSERPPKTRERNEKLGDEQTNAPVFAAAREQARKTQRGHDGAARRDRRGRSGDQALIRRRLPERSRAFQQMLCSPINRRR